MMSWLRSLFSSPKKPPQKSVVVVVEGDEHVILIPPPIHTKDQDTDVDQVVEDFIERDGVY